MVILFFRGMPTAATNSVLSVNINNSYLRAGFPNLGHATLDKVEGICPSGISPTQVLKVKKNTFQKIDIFGPI